MERLEVGIFQKMVIRAADVIIEKEPYLTEIDSQIGDGDHGEGMRRGCIAVKRLLSDRKYEYADDLCYALSTELIKTMGGASGVIFGTMFLGGISCLPHEKTVTPEELAAYFTEGERAVERRGKARPGQKTMLDALYPACCEMTEAAKGGADILGVLKSACLGALRGVEESKKMQARTGRSKNFREKTIGLPDPGAVSVSLWFQGFYEVGCGGS